MHPSRKKRRGSRTVVDKQKITVGLVICAVLLPLSVGEYVRFVYEHNFTSARQRVQELAKERPSAEATAEHIHAVATELARVRDDMCPGGLLDNIALLYPRSAAAYHQCTEFRSVIATLSAGTAQLAEQLVYATQLSSTLGTVLPTSPETRPVPSAQQENWQNVATNLGHLAVPTSFATVHQSLVTAAGTVATDWGDLAQAEARNDAAAFQTAFAKLTADVESFRALQAAFHTQVRTVQQQVSTAALSAR